MTVDNNDLETAQLQYLQLPPPALSLTGLAMYKGTQNSDDASDSSIDYSESMVSDRDQTVCDTHGSTEETHSEGSQGDDYDFKLPPPVVFTGQDEILRPSLVRKGASLDGKKDLQRFSLNFD